MRRGFGSQMRKAVQRPSGAAPLRMASRSRASSASRSAAKRCTSSAARRPRAGVGAGRLGLPAGGLQRGQRLGVGAPGQALGPLRQHGLAGVELRIDRRDGAQQLAAQPDQAVVGAHRPEQQHGGQDAQDDGLAAHLALPGPQPSGMHPGVVAGTAQVAGRAQAAAVTPLVAARAVAEDFQNLWARVLVDEVRQPGSHSLRTLAFLASLSRSDVEALMLAARLDSGAWALAGAYLRQAGAAELRSWGRQRDPGGRQLQLVSFAGVSPLALPADAFSEPLQLMAEGQVLFPKENAS